jgi:hypothetical protein
VNRASRLFKLQVVGTGWQYSKLRLLQKVFDFVVQFLQRSVTRANVKYFVNNFAALGFSRVLVDPNVFVSYDAKTFESLERVSGQVGRVDFNLRTVSRQSVATLGVFRGRPACAVCIPLDGSKGRDPDHSKTYWFTWLSYYQLLGVPVANTPNVTSLHDCTDAFAKSCALSRGNRVAPTVWNASSIC